MLRDHRTTPSLLAIDSNGSILSRSVGSATGFIAYSVYGYYPVNRAVQWALAFNGQLLDPVTQCYLLGNGYRAYSPVLQRFYSPDNQSPFGSGGINSYSYCSGDPVNKQDPSGHNEIWRSYFSHLNQKAISDDPVKDYSNWLSYSNLQPKDSINIYKINSRVEKIKKTAIILYELRQHANKQKKLWKKLNRLVDKVNATYVTLETLKPKEQALPSYPKESELPRYEDLFPNNVTAAPAQHAEPSQIENIRTSS